jgi:hypothetical protein
MTSFVLANGEILPETFHFLNVGWWIVHIVGIAGVALLGYVIGKKQAGGAPSGSAGEPPQS